MASPRLSFHHEAEFWPESHSYPMTCGKAPAQRRKKKVQASDTDTDTARLRRRCCKNSAGIAPFAEVQNGGPGGGAAVSGAESGE